MAYLNEDAIRQILLKHLRTMHLGNQNYFRRICQVACVKRHIILIARSFRKVKGLLQPSEM